MKQLVYKYPTKQSINKKIHVGVVGLGDLEISMFPAGETESIVKICTGGDGFGEAWNSVLTRFFNRYPISAGIVINDLGATPGVVYPRLT